MELRGTLKGVSLACARRSLSEGLRCWCTFPVIIVPYNCLLKPASSSLLGQAVGGCGIHNAMLYVRALKENVDEWDMGSFSWDEIYKSYLSMEDYQVCTLRKSPSQALEADYSSVLFFFIFFFETLVYSKNRVPGSKRTHETPRSWRAHGNEHEQLSGLTRY